MGLIVEDVIGFDAYAPEGIEDPTTDTNPNYDDHIFEFELDQGSTAQTVSFDINIRQGGIVDITPFGSFSALPSFGIVQANNSEGTFEWTVSEAEWITAGSPSQIQFTYATNSNSSEEGATALNPADTDSFTINITCFLAGSRIATPRGETVVEALEIGDLVLTASGRAVPVAWVGRQTVSRLRHGAHMQPVRIRAGALGGGLPESDLEVIADHGMVIDGYVINASALVNGDTIAFVPMEELSESFKVYHVETEDHDVIFANGAPAETFIDYLGRRAFDTYGEYLKLYGYERVIPEQPLPRISSARLVPKAITDRLYGDTSPVAPTQMLA